MNFQMALVPEALRDFFASRGKIALAFSGGSDSAYLYYAARACGADVVAFYVHSCFQPEFELRDACRLARELGGEFRVLEVDVLKESAVRENAPQRCYYCKKRIFSAILGAAASAECACVIDGTNASDDAGDRPGMRALRELEVESPLRMCGITKSQLRTLSRQAGLFTWDKPAYACLATRIPTGTPIVEQELRKVEQAECALSQLGFSDFRVRRTERGCRLELLQRQMPLLLERREEVLAALEGQYEEITLDLRPRKGLEL